MKHFTRKHTIAIVLGALFAGAPLLAFDYWLASLVDRQAMADVTTSAKRAISLSEARIAQTIRGLDELAGKGVTS